MPADGLTAAILRFWKDRPRRRQLIVTDITRMEGDRVCVGGYLEDGSPVRPVAGRAGPNEQWLRTSHDSRVAPFAVIDLRVNRAFPGGCSRHMWRTALFRSMAIVSSESSIRRNNCPSWSGRPRRRCERSLVPRFTPIQITNGGGTCAQEKGRDRWGRSGFVSFVPFVTTTIPTAAAGTTAFAFSTRRKRNSNWRSSISVFARPWTVCAMADLRLTPPPHQRCRLCKTKPSTFVSGWLAVGIATPTVVTSKLPACTDSRMMRPGENNEPIESRRHPWRLADRLSPLDPLTHQLTPRHPSSSASTMAAMISSGRWGAVGVEEDAAVFADDDDGAVDAVAFRSEGVVGAGDVETLVDEEVEGEFLLLDEG